MRHMKRLWLLAFVVSLCSFAVAVDEPKESKAVDRVQAASEVLNEIEAAPDSGIPEEILGRAECVAVVPSRESPPTSSAMPSAWPWCRRC